MATRKASTAVIDLTAGATGPALKAAPEPDVAPVVIIYVPGLFEPPISADAFAYRVATAIDEESPDVAPTYRVQPPSSGKAPSAAASALRRIEEVAGGKSRPVVDIHRMEYEDDLRHKFENASKLRQTLQLGFLVLFAGVFQLLPALFHRRRGKGGQAKVQLGFALGIFFGLGLYTVILLLAVVQATYQAIAGHTPDVGWLQFVALALTALGSVVPAKVRAETTNAAINYYAASSYLALGASRSNRASQLSGLLEDVLERAAPDVRVYLVGYSFGSVIAIDALFPPGGFRPTRMDRIDGLITIGCPFDMIRTVFPKYYAERPVGKAPSLWLNVFAPLDVLGSNFIDDSDAGATPEDAPASERERGKRRKRNPKWCGVGENPRAGGDPFHPDNIRWENGPLGQRSALAQVFMLSGFKVHAMYWDAEDMHDIGCIRPIVARMLAADESRFLARKPAPNAGKRAKKGAVAD